MLAQNFKAAEELGLTERGRDALIRVLGMMDRGELKDTPRGCFIPNGFNMGVTWYENECGTVGCIGGWAGFYGPSGGALGDFCIPGHAHKLGELFCPEGWCVTGKYSVKQATHALRAYLVTGTPDWG